MRSSKVAASLRDLDPRSEDGLTTPPQDAPGPHDRFCGVTRAEVQAEVGDCQLVDSPEMWLPNGPIIFEDDDLRVERVRCRRPCARLYLKVGRRVPRESWQFLIPVAAPEIDALVLAIADAYPSYSDRWSAAEHAVVRLTSTRPFLERTSSAPAVLRWSAPGEPLAFTVAPM